MGRPINKIGKNNIERGGRVVPIISESESACIQKTGFKKIFFRLVKRFFRIAERKSDNGDSIVCGENVIERQRHVYSLFAYRIMA